jgi:peptidoglycan/xylan/chitin deacetylase (PgdA/CDA1 family)
LIGIDHRRFGVVLATMALAVFASGLLTTPGEALVRSGGPKADSLLGTPQADRLSGGGGRDLLVGGAGADSLFGGPGGDRLNGGPGRDRLFGGAGDDVILARDGAVDRVDCGPGTADVAIVDATDRVSRDCEEIDAPGVDGPPAPAATGPQQTATDTTPSSPPTQPGESGPPAEKPTEEPDPGEEPTPGEDEPPVEFEEQPLAMFPDGHGWTGNGVGEFADAGPPFVVNGDRSYRITTDGTGDESIATSPLLDPVNLTGHHVSFQSQIGSAAHLGKVVLRLSSGNIETDYAEATVWETDEDPVILRSSFEYQSIPLGGFHVVGSVDWSRIDRAQIVLTDNDAGLVSLYVAGIYSVPTARQATISFSFDDGYESAFTRGKQTLSAYRYPATAYVIADGIGSPGLLSMEQLYTLRDDDHWEIAGHAFTLAAHNMPDGLDDLEPEALATEMNGLRDWIDEHGFSRRTFAYPKGAAGSEVRRYVKRDYCAARVTANGPETLPPRDDYTIRGWSINSQVTGVPQIEAAIDETVSEGTWLVLTFHNLVGGQPEKATEFGDDAFTEIVEYVRTLQLAGRIKVRTVGDAVAPYC